MATTVVTSIKYWKKIIRVMCFNTIVSNTGNTNGTCAILQEKLGKAAGVGIIFPNSTRRLFFSVCLQLPSGPEILHFMRYKEQRGRIGQNTFNTALGYTATAGTVYGKTCNYFLDNSCEFNIEIIKDNF